MKKLFASLCAALAIGLAAASPAVAQQQLQAGSECTYFPFNFRDTDGVLKGYDIDVGNELGKRLGAQPGALATMRQALATARISFKDGDGAGRLLEQVAAERRTERAARPGDAADLALAEALHNLGRARYYQARYEDARAAYSEALELRRRSAGGSDDPDIAMTLQHLAAVERRLGRLPEAMDLIDRSVAMWTRLAPESRERFQAVNNRGTILEQAGRLAEAEADFRDALSVLERTLAQDDPLVARALMNVAGAQRRQGRPAEALPLLERAAGIYARKFGPAHPDTVAARAELDEARSEAGQLH